MIIRPYHQGDEYQIVSLFEKVFSKKMPLQYWDWRFGQGNPWGSSIVVALDGETMAAHYAVSHQPVVFHGLLPCSDDHVHTVLTAQSMTTMTHPEYRGLGLFVKCATLCYSLAEAAGVKFVWSFPNKNSEHGFYNRLGWKRLGRVGLREDVPPGVDISEASVGGAGHQEWRWGEAFGPGYGALLLDEDYRCVMDSLDLHLEDSDVYTYDRDCKRLCG